MEEILSKGEINKYIETLRSAKRHSEEIIMLIKDDLEYGLTTDQTERYSKQGFNLGQMKVYSECLRKGDTEKFLSMIDKYEISAPQMKIAYEFYQKGVETDVIEDVVAKGEVPVVMRNTFNRIFEPINEMKKDASTEPEYARELVKKMEEIVSKINFQEERYDALNEKLAHIKSTKEEDEKKTDLDKKIKEKELALMDKQGELDQAKKEIVTLNDQIEYKDKEIEVMNKRIEELENGNAYPEDKEKSEPKAEDEKEKEMGVPNLSVNDIKSRFPLAEQAGIHVFYQVPVIDRKGRVVQRVQLERPVARKDGVIAMLSKLCFKKKSRADIVKLVASGDMTPAQLVQIRNGIERGLTEDQLVELINNNVTAEKMVEIIEIAVLENSMAY